METTALIELNSSHSECLFSQTAFLKKGNRKIILILNEDLRGKISDSFTDIEIYYVKRSKSYLCRLKMFLSIRKMLVGNQVDLVIFNTATGTLIWELLFFIPRRIRLAGTLHDAEKLSKSPTQKKIIKRLKKIFVLNDFIAEYLMTEKNNNVSIRAFYPIYFQKFNREPINKGKDEFWITLPGVVEQKRRNYLEIIEILKNDEKNKNIKFIFLGNGHHFNGDGDLIKRKITEYNLESRFIFFDSFVNNSTFFSYIEKSDLIMPGMEPVLELYDSYINCKISGAYNLSFGFSIPLLYHENLKHIEDLRNFGFSYNSKNMLEVISHLYNRTHELEEIKKRIGSEPKFSFEYQKENYLNFLNL